MTSQPRVEVPNGDGGYEAEEGTETCASKRESTPWLLFNRGPVLSPSAYYEFPATSVRGFERVVADGRCFTTRLRLSGRDGAEHEQASTREEI